MKSVRRTGVGVSGGGGYKVRPRRWSAGLQGLRGTVATTTRLLRSGDDLSALLIALDAVPDRLDGLVDVFVRPGIRHAHHNHLLRGVVGLFAPEDPATIKLVPGRAQSCAAPYQGVLADKLRVGRLSLEYL